MCWYFRTIFYGEYNCSGAGANTSARAPFVQRLNDTQVSPFLNLSFIDADQWLHPYWFHSLFFYLICIYILFILLTYYLFLKYKFNYPFNLAHVINIINQHYVDWCLVRRLFCRFQLFVILKSTLDQKNIVDGQIMFIILLMIIVKNVD